MTHPSQAGISASISILSAVVTISSIQPIISLCAGLVAIVTGIFSIRYYYWKTKHMNNDKY
jgi:hypothetical protein